MQSLDLPGGLPVPQDDGGADHLERATVPSLVLAATDGQRHDLSAFSGFTVLYVYPMTGRPDRALPEGWDAIPGARGCTPQSCSFRDHHAEIARLGARVFGVSTQSSAYQREARDRLHLPFQLLSDPDRQLAEIMSLPTFEDAGEPLYKRLTMVLNADRVVKVFYPVFPPDQNASAVIDWLGGQC